MLAAVNPRSNGFGGGAYQPAGRPTGVGGAFAPPGTAAASPAGVPSSGIIEARNNSGTNVRVPYARLVPMHARFKSGGGNKPDAKDPRVQMVHGKGQLEYESLHAGELAWVLGRRFKSGEGAGAAVGDPAQMEAGGASRYSHMAYAGLGSGVDRMQRLASTAWMEQMVKSFIGTKVIALHKIILCSEYQKKTDGLVATYAPYVTGGTALYCPDPVATLYKAKFDGKADAAVKVKEIAGEERVSGVFVLETGPFLRGMQVNTNDVSLKSLGDDFAAKVKTGSLPRNVGDMCVMAAIESEIRRRNFMDWSPDGVVLSKLESPTDSPLSSAELDAQQAQLFNLAVQGPAITTAWTSDVRDHKLECQPMDKVFICLVADLDWTEKRRDLLAATTTDAKAAMLASAKQVVKGNVQKVLVDDALLAAGLMSDAMGDLTESDHVTNVKKEATAYKAYLGDATDDTLKKEYEKEKKKVDAAFNNKNPGDALFKQAQHQFRSGRRRVGKAFLTNFRLMRSTSAHMTNYSKMVDGKPNSRCGLRWGWPDLTPNNAKGVASYIVGAWCIGTVLDSAASRSNVGNLVRTAPTSMALNVNVNIAWWSSDMLYKHFMDRDIHPRGRTVTGKRKDPDEADLDRTAFDPLDGATADGTKVEFAAAASARGAAGIEVQRASAEPERELTFAESAREAAGVGSSRTAKLR